MCAWQAWVAPASASTVQWWCLKWWGGGGSLQGPAWGLPSPVASETGWQMERGRWGQAPLKLVSTLAWTLSLWGGHCGALLRSALVNLDAKGFVHNNDAVSYTRVAVSTGCTVRRRKNKSNSWIYQALKVSHTVLTHMLSFTWSLHLKIDITSLWTCQADNISCY